jgi:hypothetical protein
VEARPKERKIVTGIKGRGLCEGEGLVEGRVQKERMKMSVQT